MVLPPRDKKGRFLKQGEYKRRLNLKRGMIAVKVKQELEDDAKNPGTSTVNAETKKPAKTENVAKSQRKPTDYNK